MKTEQAYRTSDNCDENVITFPQDRQCTYNVTLRRVRETIVVVKKYNVIHIQIV